jgi:uncharacterized membrane-anchored protein YhcB (DUF1043 family)
MEVISKVSPEAWAGLAGVLIGSLISIMGTWLTNNASLNQLQTQLKYERDSKKQDLHRERLEELYTLVSSWLNAMASHYLSLSRVMQGKISYNDHLDLFIKSQDQPKYQKVIDARSELNEISRLHKLGFSEGDIDGDKYLKPYTQAQLKIEKLGEELKTLIAESTKNA